MNRISGSDVNPCIGPCPEGLFKDQYEVLILALVGDPVANGPGRRG